MKMATLHVEVPANVIHDMHVVVLYFPFSNLLSAIVVYISF